MWWRIEQTWSWTWKLTRNLLKLGKEPFEMKKGEKGYVKNLRNIIYLCYRMVSLRYYMYFNLSSLVIGMRWIIACRDLLRSTFRRNSCKQVRKQRKNSIEKRQKLTHTAHKITSSSSMILVWLHELSLVDVWGPHLLFFISTNWSVGYVLKGYPWRGHLQLPITGLLLYCFYMTTLICWHSIKTSTNKT